MKKKCKHCKGTGYIIREHNQPPILCVKCNKNGIKEIMESDEKRKVS